MERACAAAGVGIAASAVVLEPPGMSAEVVTIKEPCWLVDVNITAESGVIDAITLLCLSVEPTGIAEEAAAAACPGLSRGAIRAEGVVIWSGMGAGLKLNVLVGLVASTVGAFA
jgi:hypothetical protein